MVHTSLCYPLSPDVILKYFKALTEGQPKPAGTANCTMIPDDLLLRPGTTPIFTTRDPRLTVPSAYRAMQRMDVQHGGGPFNYFSVTCPIWSRMLYDFYVHEGVEPIVIDADDYISSEKFVRLLCARMGLDPSQLHLSWTPPTEEEKKEIHPMYYASQDTLINSSGPNSVHAAKNINLEEVDKGWDGEFGEDAALMRKLVELAMPHHQYLWEKRMKA